MLKETIRSVELNGILIGHVYKSSHRVWVAQPIWSNYSASFLNEEEAVLELMIKFHEDNNSLTIQ